MQSLPKEAQPKVNQRISNQSNYLKNFRIVTTVRCDKSRKRNKLTSNLSGIEKVEENRKQMNY